MKKTTPKWKYGADIAFTKPTRTVNTIFLHCSASDVASHDDISVIENWHTVGNGWSRVGYHFFINKSGNIQSGCPIEKIPIAQKGHNTGSIAICLHGLKKAKFTDEQMVSVNKLCKAIVASYDKKIKIRGHCEVSKKSCPVFDYKKQLNLTTLGYLPDQSATKPQAKTPKSAMVQENESAPDIGITKTILTIELTAKGAHVRALQQILFQKGYGCAVDGHFGQQTDSAVRLLQKKKGLFADGVVGKKTINALFSQDNLVLKIDDRGTDVNVLQLMLAMYGQKVMHDGIFGTGTKEALKQQQRLLLLQTDGIFGPKTRQKMLT
ncbi:hypothetical protein OLMES_1293 [Oleiphilus messinensis]|uniref:N-acetylmuramoyl-L-alanine amidase domain-containing protein n=1 Tax=Oleiphilus messinensis TaxID=141451 RepID=A0A1Y0I4G6_9GAMM|nr:N-acetylmuramoyl-L-alanine amidase [Oleiphilus messinensis]ARU55372.1 hypothetical protein OLMES_1293 [Oleiphilus messinensis]